MRYAAILGAVLSLVILTTGCTTVDVGTSSLQPPKIDSLASAYVGLGGIEPYDDNILHIGLADMDERPGELLSIDLWPLVGIGIGLFGARAHVLPVEAGVGAIWYQPVPCHPEIEEEEPDVIEVRDDAYYRLRDRDRVRVRTPDPERSTIIIDD